MEAAVELYPDVRKDATLVVKATCHIVKEDHDGKVHAYVNQFLPPLAWQRSAVANGSLVCPSVFAKRRERNTMYPFRENTRFHCTQAALESVGVVVRGKLTQKNRFVFPLHKGTRASSAKISAAAVASASLCPWSRHQTRARSRGTSLGRLAVRHISSAC